MPTGYTAEIKKGVNFKEFALHCARAFGACYESRDKAPKGEIPKIKISKYHAEKLENEKERLNEFKMFTKGDYAKLANSKFISELIKYEEHAKEKSALEDNYNEMLVKITKWEPPSESHNGLKNFMIEQVELSIEHDCYNLKHPVLLTAEEWATKELKDILWQIEYHTKTQRENIERTYHNNKWATQLQESLE